MLYERLAVLVLFFVAGVRENPVTKIVGQHQLKLYKSDSSGLVNIEFRTNTIQKPAISIRAKSGSFGV